MSAALALAPRATRREWIGLAVIALPAELLNAARRPVAQSPELIAVICAVVATGIAIVLRSCCGACNRQIR